MTREQAQELLANVNGKIEMKRLDAVNLLLREIDELKNNGRRCSTVRFEV